MTKTSQHAPLLVALGILLVAFCLGRQKRSLPEDAVHAPALFNQNPEPTEQEGQSGWSGQAMD